MATTLDAEIDRLYQLTPDAFTAARNALVRSAGARAAEIKRLQKPTAAAWAVNQLYWRDRARFDRLARASADLRAAHVRHVGGKTADLAAATARHQAALAEARRSIRAFLDEAHLSSPAVLVATDRTMEAIPDPRMAGRLTRPIDPVGFGLLAGLMDAADRSRSTRALADVTLRPASTQTAHTAAPARAADARQANRARRQRIADLDRSVRDAALRERESKTAFDKARRAVDRADARIERLEADLRAAREEAGRRRDDLERTRASANDAAAARVQAERRRREVDA